MFGKVIPRINFSFRETNARIKMSHLKLIDNTIHIVVVFNNFKNK
jgi:hypothetical protein